MLLILHSFYSHRRASCLLTLLTIQYSVIHLFNLLSFILICFPYIYVICFTPASIASHRLFLSFCFHKIKSQNSPFIALEQSEKSQLGWATAPMLSQTFYAPPNFEQRSSKEPSASQTSGRGRRSRFPEKLLCGHLVPQMLSGVPAYPRKM